MVEGLIDMRKNTHPAAQCVRLVSVFLFYFLDEFDEPVQEYPWKHVLRQPLDG
jgi:hypothetical protein